MSNDMNLLRRAFSFFRVPLTRYYLRRDREYRYKDISISVRQGVFHPGLFPSTPMLLKYLSQQDLTGQSLLELGCGTGLISMVAEKAGAVATASDIALTAVENTKINAARNHSQITVVHSDLFEKIPHQHFDWIVINPPYYAKAPASESELAWYCGADFEYFRKLLTHLKSYISTRSCVLMTLTADCDVATITAIAGDASFQLEQLAVRKTLLEGSDYLFRVTPR